MEKNYLVESQIDSVLSGLSPKRVLEEVVTFTPSDIIASKVDHIASVKNLVGKIEELLSQIKTPADVTLEWKTSMKLVLGQNSYDNPNGFNRLIDYCYQLSN